MAVEKYTDNDHQVWLQFGDGTVRPQTQADLDEEARVAESARQKQVALYNSAPYMQQFTPEQTQSYLADPRAFAANNTEFLSNKGIYNDNVNGGGTQNLWLGPQPPPMHTDNTWEGIESAYRDMKPGLSIMSLMGAGSAISAGLYGAGGAAATGGAVAGSTGSGTLAGSAGADTLGTGGGEFLFPGESATSGAAGTGAAGSGGSMGDWTFNDFTGEWEPPPETSFGFDPGGEGLYNVPTNSSNTIFPNGMDSGFDLTSMVKKYGPQLGQQLYGLITKGAGGALGAVKGLLGGGGADGGGGLLDAAARSAPGLMALAYANNQPGIDVGPLQGILAQLGGNQDAVIRAAQDPVQKNIAAGYGDMLQSQAQRGIRGSSFGNTDIANYMDTTGRTLANAGATAAEGSLALQGNLAGNIATLKNQAQQIKNGLFGRAFDTLGRGLNPKGYGGGIQI